MGFPLLFSKIKSFIPVAVIGSVALITVKLLTTQTTLNQDELKVDGEEDIKTVAYEDIIEIPKEPEPEQEESVETPPSDESAEEDLESEIEAKSEPSEEEEKDSEKKEQPPASKRRFIKGGIGDILANILKPKEKS